MVPGHGAAVPRLCHWNSTGASVMLGVGKEGISGQGVSVLKPFITACGF